MAGWKIAAASPEEAAGAVDAYDWLLAPPGAPPPRWDPGRARKRLAEVAGDERSGVLLATDEGAVVGICTVYIDINSVRFGQRAWVEDLAVDPDRRSGGIGKALLDAAKEWARSRGASHLELESSSSRPDAHRFYEREQPSWKSACFAWALGEPGA
jgi:GNAT superfamily N-acetyltransferase